MATYQKRGDKWRAIVRTRGQYASDSFATKAQAKAWALMKELEFGAAARGEVPDKAFGDLIQRYLTDFEPARSDRIRLTRFLEDDLAKVPTARLRAPQVATWRDQRLKEVASASVRREWNTLQRVCSIAVREWHWLKENPFKEAHRPPDAPPRQRRPTEGEMERILFCLGYQRDAPCETLTAQVGAAALFAIETGMRATEICSITLEHLSERAVFIPKSKNGHSRTVPLSSEARRILGQLPGGTFSVTAASLDRLWRMGRDKAVVKGLHFHDLRREALTRMANKVDVMTLAKISGHRDVRVLLNVYYAEDIGAIDLG